LFGSARWLPVQFWCSRARLPGLCGLAKLPGLACPISTHQTLPVQFRYLSSLVGLSKLLTLWPAQQSCLSNLGRQSWPVHFWFVWLGPMVACPILPSSNFAFKCCLSNFGVSNFGIFGWPSNLACPILAVQFWPVRWPVLSGGLSKLLCDQTPSYAGCNRSSFGLAPVQSGLAPVQSGWSNLDATWPGACPNWIHKLESWPNWKSNWVFLVFCGGWGGTPWKKSRFWLIFSLP